MVIGDNVIIVRFVVIKCGIFKLNDESFVYDGDEFNLSLEILIERYMYSYIENRF